ncbi:NAD(P)H-nitrite reductase large subunit [Paenibacillus shirakamiensis]|uniref:NAD(P)H-nitrite reductase large subunit n=1 Tax=Paenibacillus shirakamiensis TaxID=1265935 RepID=A0ABS4JE43_9BACL|nr:nitrite reductase [Paenibacillus shirakamiensis]MBP1999984.1 NAD(P)H-nitrite reductase large subunit [Paenibacillus shirakamiensis]
MGEKTKLAVSPAIQVGGSVFTPQQLAKIGTVTDSAAKIEMTSFKQLYVEVPLDKREAIQNELEHAGLEVYPAGFATKSLIACNFCKGTKEAGLETARILNRAIAGIETPTPLKIGYAGCALGTSEPLIKDIGVIKIRDTFDIYVGGEPKGIKASMGRLLVSGVTEERLVPVVSTLIDFYKEQAKGKEKFVKFVDRITMDQLKQLIA